MRKYAFLFSLIALAFPARGDDFPASAGGNNTVVYRGSCVLDPATHRICNARWFEVQYSDPTINVNSAADLSRTTANASITDQYAKTQMMVFQTSRPIVLTRVARTVTGLPIVPGLFMQGDLCSPFRDNPLSPDPLPSLFCTGTGTFPPDQRYAQTLGFPADTGLWLPAGARLSCSVATIVPSPGEITQAQAENIVETCVYEYRETTPNEPGWRFLRMPWLDQIITDASSGTRNFIPPDRKWYRRWDGTTDLEIDGIAVYWGPRGAATDVFIDRGVCAYAVEASGVPVPGKEICMPAQSLVGGRSAANLEPIFQPGSFTVGANEYLSARCQTSAGRTAADCVVYARAKMPPAMKDGSVGVGHVYDGLRLIDSTFKSDVYCLEKPGKPGELDIWDTLTSAGKKNITDAQIRDPALTTHVASCLQIRDRIN